MNSHIRYYVSPPGLPHRLQRAAVVRLRHVQLAYLCFCAVVVQTQTDHRIIIITAYRGSAVRFAEYAFCSTLRSRSDPPSVRNDTHTNRVLMCEEGGEEGETE